MTEEFDASTIEQYQIDLFIYKKCSEKLNILAEKNRTLKKELDNCWPFVFHGLLFILAFYFLSNKLKLTSEIGAIVVLLYSSALATALIWNFLQKILPDSLINLFTCGKFYKLNKQIKETKRHLQESGEALQNERAKLEPIESAIFNYYEHYLREFFDNNLYKKRSGTPQFEESLSEFSQMIDEISALNSTLVTNHFYLRGYEDYLKKRETNHSFQISKPSNQILSIRNFVNKISQPRDLKPKDIIPPEKMYRTARKIDNWEEINKKRIATGAKGEEIAIAMEKEFFESISREDLANQIRHVSVEVGDGLGYDILSFFENGREKYIEVKTTTISLDSPYYLSKNELEFLKNHNENAFIYRFLISDDIPQVQTFSVPEVLETNEILPVQYIVRTKKNAKQTEIT